MKSKLPSIVFLVALFCFILTVSIGLPIYVRPFYYAHIGPYRLVERSGFTKEEIIDAFNEVLDYLTLPGKSFGTGVMRFSEEGASHFADCKALFSLNAWILCISALILVGILVLKRLKKLTLSPIASHHPAFWSAISAVVIPLVVGGLAATNFDRAFEIFHKLFFPGKSNWIFHPEKDEIIMVLPQDFFMNCAILIAVGVISFSAGILVWELMARKKDACKDK